MSEPLYSLRGKRIWVAGHRGMVGSALARRLAREDCEVIVTPRGDVDLARQVEVEDWMAEARPQAIFLAAAKVGGIRANDAYPADFLYQNLMIEANVVEAARRVGVEKLLLLGSSCIYPKFADQPIVEEALLTGALEPTNEWYAVAKIAGIKLCQSYRRQHGCDFIAAMPTNLYGPGDNYDLETSHVIPALLRKAHEAKAAGRRDLPIWGTGAARREFLHADDCADALVHLMQHWSDEMHVNVGSGVDVTIAELARSIMRVVGLDGELLTDPRQPDGTPRKLMDGTRLRALGWRPGIPLEAGLARVYAGIAPVLDRAEAA
ncbi:GDP-L-fucose synthase [Amaricoccus macauensis]|uniref:GDP-L-fucose synthase n=1 Tax=Amaricoccus macauensis TaxID=57001 RepID=A0A840SS18_9RHOB|nr:GDP-L-fucose synthase [Amaricoccus macauensis]MBB5223560.1 GDP-L-fucose synthase [Amaricoccus macauensis]